MFHSPLADGGVIILLILLFAAPKRLPMLTRSIGQSIKEFKGATAHEDEDKHLGAPTEPAAPAAPATPAPSAEKRDTVA